MRAEEEEGGMTRGEERDQNTREPPGTQSALQWASLVGGEAGLQITPGSS